VLRNNARARRLVVGCVLGFSDERGRRDDRPRRSAVVVTRGQSGPSGREPERESVWSLNTELYADGLTAATTFWLGPEGVEERLDDFFERLAADWRGWAGVRVWENMKGGLFLTCTHDGKGTVVVRVELRHFSGSDWTATAKVFVDAGEELDAVARDLRRLLSSSS
jgi:hypothetical protein